VAIKPCPQGPACTIGVDPLWWTRFCSGVHDRTRETVWTSRMGLQKPVHSCVSFLEVFRRGVPSFVDFL
jgi:hypothetical protein